MFRIIKKAINLFKFLLTTIFVVSIMMCQQFENDMPEPPALTELQTRTLNSFQKLDDYPFYTMEYYGEYNFEDFLLQGINPQSKGLKYAACTCFSTLNKDGNMLFGRNFDYSKARTLLLFTDPPDGYASVSMVDISFLGFGTDDPDFSSLEKRRPLLDAPYWPLDGMNECGVAMGIMSVNGETVYDPDKVTIGALHAIRLVLDYAKNVDEAVSLLQEYNNKESGENHYLISDSGGSSAVIEYYNGELVITRNTEPWQVSTNFFILNASPGSILHMCNRYEIAYNALKNRNGYISAEEGMDILENASQNSTQWSAIYNKKTGDIDIVIGMKFSHTEKFKLKMKEL